jgi:hypothetical protein
VSSKTSSTVGLKIRASTKGNIKMASPARMRRVICIAFCPLLKMFAEFKVKIVNSFYRK